MDAAPPPRLTPTDPRAHNAAGAAARPGEVQAKKPAETSPVAQAAAEQTAELQSKSSDKVQPGVLVVEMDEQAGRFVQTWLDGETRQVERRYPSEAQLAYSRAVAAYMKALSES